MPTLTAEFKAKTGSKGKPGFKEIGGTVQLYSKEELDRLIKAGLEESHASLLNQIVKIRAMDAQRKTLEDTSLRARLTAKMKADPTFEKKLAELLASV